MTCRPHREGSARFQGDQLFQASSKLAESSEEDESTDAETTDAETTDAETTDAETSDSDESSSNEANKPKVAPKVSLAFELGLV